MENDNTYAPTTAVPDERLAEATWAPLSAEDAARSIRSARQDTEYSPDHPLVKRIRGQAETPDDALGFDKRFWPSWVTLECDCSETFAIQKAEVRKGIRRGLKLYCSQPCARAGLAETLTGMEYPKRQTRPRGVKRYCEECGDLITAKYRKKTCSEECLDASREKKRIYITCPECGTTARAKSHRTVYCSRDCANEAHSKRMIGEGNSHFKTGTSYANWFRLMRPLILDRDSRRCVVCGDRSRGSGRLALVIHHLNERPWENRPENLITLCHPCHMTHHKSTVSPFPWFAAWASGKTSEMPDEWLEAVNELVEKYEPTAEHGGGHVDRLDARAS